MARYNGPKQKKARAFGEPIYGFSKAFEKKKYAPGMHGNSRKRKQRSDYAVQLMEKQKAKYTYGVLERQFWNLFVTASHKHGVTGTLLLQFLEARLDNTVFRLGIAPTRRAARQLISHRHIVVNGTLTNVPSCQLRPGDIIEVKGPSKDLPLVKDQVGKRSEIKRFTWLEFNPDKMRGVFMSYPEREQIPEKINEQLIVELYSK